MQISGKITAGLLAASTLVLFAPVTRAEEMLVMPYRCTMAGGQPLLTPARDEGHRILGQREQRQFKACAPGDPEMCRQWTVFRFDLDCGGARVPWMAVAAVAGDMRYGRPVIRNGQLNLPMPPRWGAEPDDPCIGQSRYNRWSGGGGFARFCDDRRALSPSAMVEMPPGFAPMMGIDGIFVPAQQRSGPVPPMPMAQAAPQSGAATGSAPGPGGVEVNALPPLPSQSGLAQPTQPKAQALPPPKAVAGAGPAPKSSLPFAVKPEPPPQQQVTAELLKSPGPEARDKGAREAAKEAKFPPALQAAGQQVTKAEPPAPALDAGPPKTPGGIVIPKVINSAEPQTAAPTPLQPSQSQPASKPETVAAASPPPAPVEPPAKTIAEAPAPAPASPPQESKAAMPEAAALPQFVPQREKVSQESAAPATVAVSLVSMVGDPMGVVALAFGAFSLLIMAAYATSRRRERARLQTLQTRDIAHVSLDGVPQDGAHLPAIVPVGASGQPLTIDPEGAPRAVVPAVQTSTAFLALGTAMPQTRDDAFAVLGMGVALDAGEPAIKKIVDGLRLSWHPDYAQDPDDRRARELRLQQINAAWEILSGRRSAA
jgi:hypothetical protein